jgi:archaemetzincin
MRIMLCPIVTNLDNNIFRRLALDVSREFKNVRVTVDSSQHQYYSGTEIQSAFDKLRNQWNSDKLLGVLSKKLNQDLETKFLFIYDADAYSSSLNFVFGESASNGSLAIVYLARLRQEYYGLPPNQNLFYERMVKESIHELGHVFGLKHCSSTTCIMYFSNSLQDTDKKERRFCENCRHVLVEALR